MTEQKKLSKWLQERKEINIPSGNLISTEEAIKDNIVKYKEIIFGVDSSICTKCLDELLKQQVIDRKLYDQRLMDAAVRNLAWKHLQKNMEVDGDMLIDKKTCDPEVHYDCYKNKF